MIMHAGLFPAARGNEILIGTDNSRAVERWNALSSLRKPKGPFEG